MRSDELYSFSIFKTVAFSILLWLYAGVLIFVWFFARQTFEDLVLVRIGASVVSDIVWLPLGIVVWTATATWFAALTIRTTRKNISFMISSVTATVTVVFVIVFPDTAFRFLFLPLIVLVVRALLSLLKHRNVFILSLVYIPSFIVIAATVLYYGCQMIPSFSNQENETDIKVMTYNIFGHADTQGRMEVIETIKREYPDLVCCTEYTPRKDLKVFKEKLGDFYPYIISNRHEKSWGSGELILSRYPITINRIPDVEYFKSNFVFAEMMVGNQKVNVIVLHLPHARIKKWSGAQSVLGHIQMFHDPVIICGDLNDTPNCRVYNLFANKYVNTVSSKGWGLCDTFGESWIKTNSESAPTVHHFAHDFIRIDHIFISEHFDVISSWIIKNAGGSDHKPVMAVVRLKKPANTSDSR